ncbi:MAG: SusC/RagA family TonB-linked outer membrane protein, partial [Muribaculaceae bacterium]|nr:SusC/RagA family TonB-linked outer membrane protein [Muribaculaceae bacterium]
GSEIEVTFVGFKPIKEKVGNKAAYECTLYEAPTDLDEVVVTAYGGGQKKASVIGSIETVKPALLQVGSSRSMSANLAGNIAGVIGVRRSGEPGYDNSNFWIRGISTFSGSVNPLVLIDGVERDLNNIDPAEIESFSVLKDASASAMYGVRGANGVIVINTKRGTVGKPKVDIRFEQSISKPTKLPDYADGVAYMNLLNSLQPEGAEPLFSQEYIERTASGYDPDLYPNVDWIDAITKDYAYSTRANISVNGGSNFLRYALTASLYNESGIMERDYTLDYDTSIKLTRYNLRTNVDVDVTSTTTLRMNLGGYLQNRKGPNCSSDGAFWMAFNHSPVMYPYRYSDGTVPDACVSGSRQNAWWALTQQGHTRSSESQIQALVALEQDLKMITPGLKAKATFAFDSYQSNWVTRGADSAIYHKATGRDEEGNLIHLVDHKGDGSLGHDTGASFGNKRTYFEVAAMYNQRFGVHDFDAMFLFNRQWYDEGSTQPFRKQGVAGRLSYIFDSRYVAEFNFGYNGSENFAPGKRYGFFPSFALGWLMSSERFMAGVAPIFNKIKFRGSYGKVGNDNIGGRRFAYISTVNTSGAGMWFGVPGAEQYWGDGITEGEVGVENLTWETAWKANLGLELGIANQVDFHIDFFRENRSN